MARTRRRDPDRWPAPFVVGVGRSGTTLLRLMLDAHPRLAIPPETHFVPELIARARLRVPAEELVNEIVAARNWEDFGLDPGALRGRVAASGDVRAATVLR
ncbi:MAG: sulfotransferase, partial [Solirubrobacterales bacterium]